MGRKQAVVAATVATGVFAAVGVAAATIPDSEGVIHSCYMKSGGALRVVDDETTPCGKGETALSWGQQGPPGPLGLPGPPVPRDRLDHRESATPGSCPAQHPRALSAPVKTTSSPPFPYRPARMC